DIARILLRRTPDRAVDRARDDRVQVVAHLGVTARIELAAGRVPRPRDLPVAVRVEDLRAPALRRLLVARQVELTRVDPADDRTEQLVEVERVVRVVVEL